MHEKFLKSRRCEVNWHAFSVKTKKVEEKNEDRGFLSFFFTVICSCHANRVEIYSSVQVELESLQIDRCQSVSLSAIILYPIILKLYMIYYIGIYKTLRIRITSNSKTRPFIVKCDLILSKNLYWIRSFIVSAIQDTFYDTEKYYAKLFWTRILKFIEVALRKRQIAEICLAEWIIKCDVRSLMCEKPRI